MGVMKQAHCVHVPRTVHAMSMANALRNALKIVSMAVKRRANAYVPIPVPMVAMKMVPANVRIIATRVTARAKYAAQSYVKMAAKPLEHAYALMVARTAAI